MGKLLGFVGVCASRLSVCFVFHAVVEEIVEKMQEANEVACIRALRQHYLTSIPATSFHIRQHGCLTLADLWAGLCRLQPHRHKLKKHICHLRQDLPPFVQALESFTSSRLDQLRLQGPELPGMPVEPFRVF